MLPDVVCYFIFTSICECVCLAGSTLFNSKFSLTLGVHEFLGEVQTDVGPPLAKPAQQYGRTMQMFLCSKTQCENNKFSEK